MIRLSAVALVSGLLLAACSGEDRTAASAAKADSSAQPRVWTPEQARALRNAAQHPDPAGAMQPPAAPAPAAEEDSATWARSESQNYEQRKRSMGSYASCIAQARGLEPTTRASIETACRRLPDAPR
jgi:hypothetical protein